MSITSRARSIKRPNQNARKDLKRTLAAKPARVLVGNFRVTTTSLAFNEEPGHRDLGLIRKSNRHGQYVGPGGALVGKKGGAFGGVDRAERQRRKALRES